MTTPTIQAKEEVMPLPMPELRYFVSDRAVKNNHGLHRGSGGSLISSDSEAQELPPVLELNLDHLPPIDALDSLESICSVISGITLPDSLACKRRDSHTRFEHRSPSPKKTVTEAMPPRIPTRQRSRNSLLSSSDSKTMPPPPPPKAPVDTSPKKPERRLKKKPRVVKKIRQVIGSICSYSTSPDDNESVTSRSFHDFIPTFPLRRGSIASSVAA